MESAGYCSQGEGQLCESCQLNCAPSTSEEIVSGLEGKIITSERYRRRAKTLIRISLEISTDKDLNTQALTKDADPVTERV